MATERDYVLGTHDEELARLGLQNEVWRPVVLEFWQRAGITTGSRVLDVGAGPGYATVDLAQIVGPGGAVVSLERSSNFVKAMRENIRARSLSQVQVHELDLMTDELPRGDYDFAWCRWVATFVTDPALLVQKIGGVLKKGGHILFHEYGDYLSWRFSPRLPLQEEFARKVAASWRAAGGEPDIALQLPPLLHENGFAVRSAVPRIFCIAPNDRMWQWPSSFVGIGLDRLQQLGVLDEQFARDLRAEFAQAEANPNSLMLTPLVMEIIAEKIS